MKRLTNTFTVIFAIAALASFYQLGSLGNGITEGFAKTFEATVTPSISAPAAKPTSAIPSDTFTPERITIDEVDIDLLVFSQPIKNGTWEVLPDVANYAEGTSLVNPKDGNVGIFAHDRLVGFTKIKQLAKGAEIIVYGNGQKATYKLTESRIVEPTDVNVFNPTVKPTLTLITCDGLFSEKRYMVQAELVKIELATK